MNAITTRFPEVARYAMSETRSTRLVASFATSMIVGLCALLAGYAAAEPGDTLFKFIFWLQAIVLLVYGTSRATSSVMTERVERTWDLQRLTPLSAFDLTIGKLLGAPIFVYYLFAILLPWAATGFILSEQIGLSFALRSYLTLGATAFLFYSVGLLVSSHATGNVGAASSGTAGALMGFFALQASFPMILALRNSSPAHFYGHAMQQTTLFIFSSLSFGIWALAGTKWRIGEELLEGSRFWRLPAFMAFLVWFQLGWERRPIYAGMMTTALFCYFVGVLNPKTPDYWKQWILKDQDRLNRIPGWINACSSFTVLALMVSFISWQNVSGSEDDLRRYPLLQACFLVRDLAFLQWCRFTKSRKPEIMALVFIVLAYALPSIVLNSFKIRAFFFVAAPVPEMNVGAFTNLLPGLAQAIAMCLFLARTVKRHLASFDKP